MKKEYADIVDTMAGNYNYDEFVEECKSKSIYPLSFQGWAQTVGMCLHIAQIMPDRDFETAKAEIFNKYEKPMVDTLQQGMPCCGGGAVR